MVLDGRSQISDFDWKLATTVMARSDVARRYVRRAMDEQRRERNRGRAAEAAERDEYISDNNLSRAKRAVLRRLDALGPQRLAGHVQRFACGGLDDGRARLAVADRDLHQLVGSVGHKPQLAVESARQTWVHGEEFVDFLLVSGAGETEVEPMHLQCPSNATSSWLTASMPIMSGSPSWWRSTKDALTLNDDLDRSLRLRDVSLTISQLRISVCAGSRLRSRQVSRRHGWGLPVAADSAGDSCHTGLQIPSSVGLNAPPPRRLR